MRILLVADVPNWAFDRDASAVIQYLPQYQISKTFTGAFHPRLLDKFDHVHFMNWLEGRSWAPRISAGVSSHNFELLHLSDSKKFFPKYKALVATSQILFDRVKSQNDHVFCAQGGVHEDMFVPLPKEPSDEFVVGWVGQKTSGGLNRSEAAKIDIKGYHLVLEPLMRLCKNDNIKFKTHSSNYKNATPYPKMPAFYTDVDCQICTSLAEGAPNPMFEAASCGKALISTRVGAISECIQEGVNGFLIDAYSKREELQDRIEKFREKILFLRDNRDICQKMGQESRRIVEADWTWKKRVQRWIPLFEHIEKTKG